MRRELGTVLATGYLAIASLMLAGCAGGSILVWIISALISLVLLWEVLRTGRITKE